jgi:hypothetical protein
MNKELDAVGIEVDGIDQEGEEDSVSTSRSRGGRPPGTTRYSDKLVILKDTDRDGYVQFKALLELFPEEVRKRALGTGLPHSNIHNMSEYAEKMSEGIVAVSPLLCKGDSCQYSARCELLSNNLAPIDKACPIEMYLIESWAREWVTAMEVDMSNKVERDQVASIIMCDLMLMRIGNRLSLSPTGNIVYTPVGVDKNGNVILRMEPAPEIAMQELKNSVQESLLATRESRAKHGISDDKDLAKSSAKAMYKGQQIIAQITAENKKLASTIFKESE